MVEKQLNQTSLFSKTLQAGKGRVYFFDIKEAKNNEKYLIISESRLRNGTRERFRLIVFNNSLPGFTQAMGEAIRFIQCANQPPGT